MQKNLIKILTLSLITIIMISIPTTIVEGQEYENSDSENEFNILLEPLDLNKPIFVDIEQNKGDYEAYNNVKNVYECAYNLVGAYGDCFSIVRRFVNLAYGDNYDLAELYVVSEPRPGDILYYYNGGLGYEHWGIYLDSNMSLQGNYNGTTVILNQINLAGYMPIYYRLVGM